MDWAKRNAQSILGDVVQPFHPLSVRSIQSLLVDALRTAAAMPSGQAISIEDWEAMASRLLSPMDDHIDPEYIEGLHSRITGALIASQGRPAEVIERKSVLAK
tara:strand:- start:550 stop:858 length:309 start_codon:yes stop_codon:yes gene_type:complete